MKAPPGNSRLRGARRAGALAALVAMLAGCSAAPATPPGSAGPSVSWGGQQVVLAQGTGALAFRFDVSRPTPTFTAQTLPQNAAKVVLGLTSSVLSPPLSIDITPEQFANGAVLFTVHSLPVGQYTVSAAVRDSSNANLAAGSTTASVSAGTTTPVTMLLSTNADNTTGALQVSIDTTSTNAPAAAVTLPGTGTVLQTVTLAAGSNPTSLAVDSAGKLWVASNGTGKVTKVDLSTTPATLTEYTVATGPMGIAMDGSGNAWVTNNGAASVHKISSSGTISGPYTVNAGPAGIAIDGSGNAWVACNGTFTSGTGGNGTTVQKLNSSGTVTDTYTVPAGPWGIAFDGSGNAWVGTTTGVSKITAGGIVTSYTVSTTDAKHLQSGLAVSGDGSVWTANDGTNNATKLTSAGAVSGHFALGAIPVGIAIDGYKAIWVAASGGNTLTKLDSNGTVLGTFLLPSGTSPWGVALDGKGNPWVAGKGNSTLVKLGR